MRQTDPSRQIKPATASGFCDIGVPVPAIQPCEQRLALSASLMGGWLAEWADPLQIHPACSADAMATQATDLSVQTQEMPPLGPDLDALLQNQPAGSLLEQAQLIRPATGLDGRGQTIAVIDSGIAYDHISLGGGFGPGYRVVGGYDFAENDADPYDDAPSGYHGSHVAGLVGASGRMDTGEVFQGVAPGADLVGLRVFDDAGRGNLQWIESALQWVIENQDTFENPITTVNLSLGTELNDSNRFDAMALLEDELKTLYEDNIMVFAAAGNSFATMNHDTTDALMYPASSQYVVAVGSTDANDALSDFSQREDGILATAGEAQRSTVPEHVYGIDGRANDFALLSGTSMASPQMAGAAMLVRQAMSDAGLDPTVDSISARLRDTADNHVDPVSGVRYQTLNLEAALAFAMPDGPTTSQPDVSVPDPTVTDPTIPDAPANTTLTHYNGTSGSDEVLLDLRGLIAAADGIATGNVLLSDASGVYDLNTTDASARPLIIDAGSGGDVLRILGSAEAESLLLRPPSSVDGVSRLTFLGGVIEIRGFESVAFVGGGGSDRATLYDSTGDDVLNSSGQSARMTGTGFEFNVEQVSKLFAHATAGGEDSAHLNDSAGDDRLVIRPQFSSLRSDTQTQAVFGFERVFAYAEAGGHDSADLGDSAGNDVMSISQSRATISSAGYRASAMGFDDITANASAGGDDTVRIYVNQPGGTWHTTDSLTQWNGADGTTRIARGFEHSETFERFDTIASQTNSNSTPNDGPTPSIASLAFDEAGHRDALRRMFETL